MIRNAFLALAASALITGAASAQTAHSSTQKFFIGLGLNGSSIKFEGDGNETESGPGFSLQLGYGFTPKFAMFVEGTGAALDDDDPSSDNPVALGHFDIGARYHFSNPSRKLVPFLEVALTGRALAQDDATFDDGAGGTQTADVSYTGGGFSFGGGLLYFFNPRWALNGGVKWTVGEFSTVTVDNVSVSGFEADATSARLTLGVSWFPKGGK
jgi:hypothetical protein